MKPHTFTDNRILKIHGMHSHCGCICVCGHWYGFKIFPFSLSLKFSVPYNASQKCFSENTNLISVWLNIVIPKIRCDNLSGEEIYCIH
jgi:hypothetical protein